MTTHKNAEKKWNFETNTIYEFTFCPRDDKQYFHKARGSVDDRRDQKAAGDLREILESYGKHLKFNLLFELSMPQYGQYNKNEGSRIHWHGIIVFMTKRVLYEFLLTGLTKLADNGRYQFNEYRPDIWDKYCMKHQWLFKYNQHLRVKNCEYKIIKQLLNKEQGKAPSEARKETLDGARIIDDDKVNIVDFDIFYTGSVVEESGEGASHRLASDSTLPRPI